MKLTFLTFQIPTLIHLLTSFTPTLGFLARLLCLFSRQVYFLSLSLPPCLPPPPLLRLVPNILLLILSIPSPFYLKVSSILGGPTLTASWIAVGAGLITAAKVVGERTERYRGLGGTSGGGSR